MTIRQSGFLKDIQGTYIPKDPLASLQYGIDWKDWLETGDTLNASTWTVETTGTSAVTTSGDVILDGVALVTIEGGLAGELYTLRNDIETNQGYSDTRRFRIKVENRFL